MLKAFFRDSAIYGLARALTGAITLLCVPIYTRALSPSQYGLIDLLASAAAVVHVTVALEIAQGYSRYANAPDMEDHRASYASTALWFTICAYSAFIAGGLPFARALSGFLFETSAYALEVRVALLVAWATGCFNLLQCLLRFQGLAKKFAIVTIVFTVTSVSVSVLLLLVAHAGVVALLAGQLVATLLAVGLALAFSRAVVRFTFDVSRCRQMLRFSAPLVPSGVGIMLCLYVDRYMVARLLSTTDLGYYAVAARVASVIPVALTGFQFALTPLIFQEHEKPETPRQVAHLFRWFLAMTLPLLMFLGVFAPDIVRLVASPAYREGSRLIFTLGVSMMLSGIYIFSPGLWVAKRTTIIAAVSIVCGVLNLGLNALFIPRVGLIGAALATATSALVGAACHFWLGQRFFQLPFQWLRIVAAAAVTVAAGVVGFNASSTSVSTIGLRVAAWLVLCVLTTAILVDLSELRELARLVRRRAAA